MKQIYLDYAASTPLDPEILEVMLPYLKSNYFNPSADYNAAREVAHSLAKARSEVAGILGVKTGEIVFTAGGSEANNLAIKGVMDAYPEAKVLFSAIEHDSLLIPASHYAHDSIKVDHFGRIDLEDLRAKLDDSVVLISVMYCSNEVGTIEPLRQIAAILKAERVARSRRGNRLPLLMHSDACQAANYLDLHVNRLGVDLMTLNGSKMYGPKQSGVLFVKSGVNLRPLIEGGGQEFGLRSGTENVAGAIGFAAALTKAQALRETESRRLCELRDHFISRLQSDFNNININGSLRQRLPNNVHVTFPNQDNERLLYGLDAAGIMAAAGSACSAAKNTPSHVLAAMGFSEEYAHASLRFSLGRQTLKVDINRTLLVLKTLIT